MSDQQAAPQGPPYLKKIVYMAPTMGIVKEGEDQAFMYIDLEGTAHVFPFDEATRSNIVEALTGGISVPSRKSLVLPS